MSLRSEEIITRPEALHRARVDSQIEGIQAHPQDAAILDDWAKGNIGGDEARRQLDTALRNRLATKTGQTAA